jgi:serine phosphatase RsbU (regulator of sigma subunit)
VRTVGEGEYGHLLGVMPQPAWTPVAVPLGRGSAVLLYTDGLIEGRTAPGAAERFGIERLIALTDELTRAGVSAAGLLDGLLAEVQARNGGPLADDVALCLVAIPGAGPDGG